MKLFLDANVIIDFLDRNRDNNKIVNSLFELLFKSDYDLVISEDILTTIFYVCKKTVVRKKLLNFLQMLNEEFYIVSFGSDCINESIKLCGKNSKLDLEDTLQSVCAEKENCDLIISNDKKFTKLNVNILSIEDFIKNFKHN